MGHPLPLIKRQDWPNELMQLRMAIFSVLWCSLSFNCRKRNRKGNLFSRVWMMFLHIISNTKMWCHMRLQNIYEVWGNVTPSKENLCQRSPNTDSAAGIPGQSPCGSLIAKEGSWTQNFMRRLLTDLDRLVCVGSLHGNLERQSLLIPWEYPHQPVAAENVGSLVSWQKVMWK